MGFAGSRLIDCGDRVGIWNPDGHRRQRASDIISSCEIVDRRAAHVTDASFIVEVTPADTEAFARLSGDWNPLHTDAAYASTTPFKRPVLHGAFSAGLVSRLAGMDLPGRDCLLHGMRLRFVAPIIPPARLVVRGEEKHTSGALGRVD